MRKEGQRRVLLDYIMQHADLPHQVVLSVT